MIIIPVLAILGMVILANLDQIRRLPAMFRHVLHKQESKSQRGYITTDRAVLRDITRVLPYLCYCALFVDVIIALAMSTSVFAVVVALLVIAYAAVFLLWFWVLKELLILIFRRIKYIVNNTTMRFIMVWLQRQQIMLSEEIKCIVRSARNRSHSHG